MLESFSLRLQNKISPDFAKAFLLFTLFMSFGGLVWGIMCVGFGFYIPSVVPFGYLVGSMLNLLFIYQTRNFKAGRIVQVLMSLFLPFLLQWMLGGYEATGAVMMWAILGLIALLSFFNTKGVFPWLAIFIVLTVASIYFDEHFSGNIPQALQSETVREVLFAINVGMISTMLFFLGRYFIILQRQALKEADAKNKELVIAEQEKEAAYQELLANEEELRQNAEELWVTNETLEQERNKLTTTMQEMERLSLVAQEVSNGVIITNKEGITEWVNPSFERLTGYKAEAILGKKPGHLLQGPETSPETVAEIRFRLTLNEPFSVEILNYHRLGVPFWINLQITPVYSEDQQLVKYISIQTDVTERKNAEQQLKVAFKELQGLKVALEGALEGEKSAKVQLEKTKDSEIAKKNEKILSSLRYAQRIQRALLPEMETIQEHLPDSFILFRPRDMVSGDFYWFETEGDNLLLAAVDCTGHGVPGAIMSMIGMEQLTEIVNIYSISEPDKILYLLHEGVKNILKQDTGNNIKDGMDLALVRINLVQQEMEFVGAKNPIVYIQPGPDGKPELHYIKGDKFPIAGGYLDQERTFKAHKIDISVPTTFYLFSDGFQDQFGGKQNRKFMSTKFRDLLFSIHREPMALQRTILEHAIVKWMKEGGQEQIDDILVMGIRINDKGISRPIPS